MIKYYIIDEAIGEEENKEKQVKKDDFLTSFIYNLDEAVEFGDFTTYQALTALKNCYDSINKRQDFEASVNGFTYIVEAIA